MNIPDLDAFSNSIVQGGADTILIRGNLLARGPYEDVRQLFKSQYGGGWVNYQEIFDDVDPRSHKPELTFLFAMDILPSHGLLGQSSTKAIATSPQQAENSLVNRVKEGVRYARNTFRDTPKLFGKISLGPYDDNTAVQFILGMPHTRGLEHFMARNEETLDLKLFSAGFIMNRRKPINDELTAEMIQDICKYNRSFSLDVKTRENPFEIAKRLAGVYGLEIDDFNFDRSRNFHLKEDGKLVIQMYPNNRVKDRFSISVRKHTDKIANFYLNFLKQLKDVDSMTGPVHPYRKMFHKDRSRFMPAHPMANYAAIEINFNADLSTFDLPKDRYTKTQNPRTRSLQTNQ